MGTLKLSLPGTEQRKYRSHAGWHGPSRTRASCSCGRGSHRPLELGTDLVAALDANWMSQHVWIDVPELVLPRHFDRAILLTKPLVVRPRHLPERGKLGVAVPLCACRLVGHLRHHLVVYPFLPSHLKESGGLQVAQVNIRAWLADLEPQRGVGHWEGAPQLAMARDVAPAAAVVAGSVKLVHADAHVVVLLWEEGGAWLAWGVIAEMVIHVPHEGGQRLLGVDAPSVGEQLRALAALGVPERVLRLPMQATASRAGFGTCWGLVSCIEQFRRELFLLEEARQVNGQAKVAAQSHGQKHWPCPEQGHCSKQGMWQSEVPRYGLETA
mmetsp:Transcript_80575/g.236790  ORF Transcript_80575/g.236790 Transcript_80575/m.236790 type:complete len:326 (-) Transcript_80575:24-1001(-)